MLTAIAHADSPPAFTGPARLESTTGYVSLSWQPADQSEDSYELQMSPDPDFRQPQLLYRGANRQLFVSGLEDGTYYYRVRQRPHEGAPTPWSQHLQLSVLHHPPGRTWLLFSAGALVFVLTVGVILAGPRIHSDAP